MNDATEWARQPSHGDWTLVGTIGESHAEDGDVMERPRIRTTPWDVVKSNGSSQAARRKRIAGHRFSHMPALPIVQVGLADTSTA